MKGSTDVIVLGGGASGFSAAITAASKFPAATVKLLEKSHKLLSKVKISGGGRCNVTTSCFEISRLVQHYPRGGKELRKAFIQFSPEDTVRWFEERGVKLKTEADGRIFPVSDNSQSIIDCLIDELQRKDIELITGIDIKDIRWLPHIGKFNLTDHSGGKHECSNLIIATGGHPKREHYAWIENLGHTITELSPSLFTFNVPGSDFKDLMGISVEAAKIRIPEIKMEQSGPLLITHWGFSGPAVLRLSAWGARELARLNYQFRILINWCGELNEDRVRELLTDYQSHHIKQTVCTNPLFELSKRLWMKLCFLSEIEEYLKWQDIPKKKINRLVERLVRSEFFVKGKTTFKEEFVTCGGVDLSEVDFSTMESKNIRGLFFAGEVLDIDGITGGFNFQAAWSTGWVAGKSIRY